MKATKRKIPGRNGWEVLVGGVVVGEVFRQGTGDGLFLPFRPAVPTGEVDPEEGPIMRVLQAQSTLAGAVEAVRLASAPKVAERVTFVGVGMTQKKADQFAEGIRRRIMEDER